MTTQPEALWLADYLDAEANVLDEGRPPNLKSTKRRAAAELRRLHAEVERLREAGVGYSQQTMDAVVRERKELQKVNAELLAALEALLAMPDYDGTEKTSVTRCLAKHKARAAIAKAEEVKP